MSDHPRTRSFALPAFLALVVGGGLIIGYLTAPGAWYQALEKPSFNPPNWIFGPVWTILYVIIGVVGWRIWRRGKASPAMALWWMQLALNFLWSPVFFGLHQILAAAIIVSALFVTVLAFMAFAWRVDRVSTMLFLPYAAWVGFASALNIAILSLNP